MPQLTTKKYATTLIGFSVPAFLAVTLAFGVEPNVRTFTAGQQAKVDGVIVSRDGQSLKVRGDDDSIGTIDLTQDTKIELKKGGLSAARA